MRMELRRRGRSDNASRSSTVRTRKFRQLRKERGNVMRINFVFAITTCALSTAVLAQGKLDHLLCYQVRDPLRVQAVLDGITEQQPEFSRRRCKIIRPIEFCVPVTKTSVNPPHPEGP